MNDGRSEPYIVLLYAPRAFARPRAQRGFSVHFYILIFFHSAFYIKFIKQYFFRFGARQRGRGECPRAKTSYSFEAKMTTYRDSDLRKGTYCNNFSSNLCNVLFIFCFFVSKSFSLLKQRFAKKKKSGFIL